MGKFKVGDKVRVLRHRNFYGHDVEGYGISPGTVITLKGVDTTVSSDKFTMFSVDDLGDGFSWLIRSDDIEPVNDDSPIRTVTRREIVPGKYGVIRIDQGVRGPVLDLWKANPDAEELRAAARIFNEIADVLDEQSAEVNKEAA